MKKKKNGCICVPLQEFGEMLRRIIRNSIQNGRENIFLGVYEGRKPEMSIAKDPLSRANKVTEGSAPGLKREAGAQKRRRTMPEFSSVLVRISNRVCHNATIGNCNRF